ncbi:MAG TPA: hypothetical protein VGF46_00940 [Gaiellales bacterium]
MRATALAVLAAAAMLAPGAQAATVHVTSSLSPHPTRFGDVVHATLTVRAAARASVDEGFAPFEVLRATSTSRRDGAVTVTTWRFDLQCLQAVCAPGPGPRNVALTPSRVRVGAQVVNVRFPAVHVVPRVTKGQVARPTRYFLHPISPPAPSYGVSPGRLRAALLAAAAVLVLIALVLVLPLLRRRRNAADDDLDALVGALALVRAARTRPAPDRRRALGLLSRVLRSRAAPAVGQDAADLAWSEPEPEPERMTSLADRVEGT